MITDDFEPGEEPSAEEREAARALASAIDQRDEGARGPLVELAWAIRASEGEPRALGDAIVTRALEAGHARRRARRARVVVSVALAAAAILLGVIGIEASLEAPRDRPAPPSVPAETPLDETEPASARVDRMARLAAHDFFVEAIAAEGGAP